MEASTAPEAALALRTHIARTHTLGTHGTRHTGAPARGGATVLPRLLWSATVAAVLVQIPYPLLSGAPLRAVTVAAVLLLGTATTLHAIAAHGPAAAARATAATVAVALTAEAIGLRTGIPFGRYSYADTLGPAILGVPLLVLAAWTMMAYPCLVMARRLSDALPGSRPDGTGRRARVAGLGALALAGWDLFLDPQMVAAGHWAWTHPQPALPGVPGVPITDYAGWLAVGAVLIALLDAALPTGPSPTLEQPSPRQPGPEQPSPAIPATPAVLLGWAWLGSTLASAAFLGRPAVAAYTFVGLGATVGPYLLLVRRDLPRVRRDLLRAHRDLLVRRHPTSPAGVPR